MIHINKINKWYGEFHVLTDVDEVIENGQTVVICGPSGSGKSTLLRCINGLEPYQKGEILVDDVSVGDPKTNLYKLREKIGMVFQRFELYPHMTAMENIVLAPRKVRKWSKEKAQDKAMELLKRVGMVDKADAYPANLSGGLIGTMHAVGATGIFSGVECLWQIQNKYDKFHGDPKIWQKWDKEKPADWQSLQVPNAKTTAWISHAGVGSHVTMGILKKAF